MIGDKMEKKKKSQKEGRKVEAREQGKVEWERNMVSG